MLILGVTGSIAVYKAAELTSQLVQKRVDVRVVMTRRAQEFVTPLTFEALSGQSVLTDETYFSQPMAHIDWTDQAKLFLIAPASANTIARFAHGLADDVLTTMALAVNCPLWIAPAMNTRMWEHRATQDNVTILKNRGVEFVGPQPGHLACGHVGAGRMEDVNQLIERVIETHFFSLRSSG